MRKIQITKTPSDCNDESISSYLSSIAKMTPISSEEEVELSRQIQHGDRVALERLIGSNLHFVVSVAKQFLSRGLELADLIEEGNIGLCKAAEKFDGSRGFRFSTFAVTYIQQAIIDAIAEKGRLVRLPHGQITTLHKIKAFMSDYEQKYEETASIEDIAKALEITPSLVKTLLATDRYAYRLDAPLAEDSDASVSDYFSAIDDADADFWMDQEDTRSELDMLMKSRLQERDIYVIRHSFGLGCEELSQAEIAANLGLSRESIRLIREKALVKLRLSGSSKGLKLCS